MRLPILLLLFLLFDSFSHATQSSAEAKNTGEVQGVVLEATSNEPIRKALVILRKDEEPGIGTYTDDAGKFVLHAVDPGTYLISAEHSGFVGDPKTLRQSVTVNADDAGAPITLKLNRTGAISGRIVDSSGEPVTGANVQLQPLNPKRSRPATSYASSDDHGNYRAYNIQPGRYKMSVTYSSRRGDARVKIQEEKDKAKDASPDAYGKTYYPGTLDPAQATTIQIDPGADVQGIDIELRHTKTVRVRGKVSTTDGELPPPLVMVVLVSFNGGDSVNTQVHPDGSFELAEVAPGRYSLGALEFLQHGDQLTANQPLEVGEADMDGVQLTLSRVQRITGAVIMPVGRKLPAGLVVVLRSRGQVSAQFGSQSGGFAQLSESGTFSVENVVPGDYDVVMGNVGKGEDLYVAYIRSGDQDILTSGLHIGGSAPKPIELVLKASGAEIQCTVFDEKQKPIPEAHVTLLPDPPRRSQIALRGECQTNASGKCTLLGIAPGDYHVFAIGREDSEDFRDPATMEDLEKAGKAITVVEGDRKSMQLGVLRLDNQE